MKIIKNPLLKTDFDEHYFTNPLYKTKPYSKRDYLRLDFVKKYRKGGNLLEVGSAEGYFLNLLSKYFNVTGIEFSKYASDIAKKVVKNGKIIHGSVDDVDFDNDKYDVVIALNILEHLDDPEKALKKLNKSLKSGGILIGSVPNYQYLFGSLITILGNQLDKTHVSTYKVNKWRKLMKKTGYEKVDELGEFVFNRGHSKFQRSLFWPFIGMNYIFVYKKKRTR